MITIAFWDNTGNLFYTCVIKSDAMDRSITFNVFFWSFAG